MDCEKKTNLPPLFRKIGKVVCRKTGLTKKLKESGKCDKLLKQLQVLCPGEQAEQLLEDYYQEKIAWMALILLLGSMLAGMVKLQLFLQQEITGNSIVRQEYGQGERELTLKAQRGKETIGTYQIRMQEKVWEEELAQEKEAEFFEEVKRIMTADNRSLQEVRGNLNLPEILEGYPFWVSWSSSKPWIIRQDGQVEPLKEGKEDVILTALVSYDTLEWEHTVEVTVKPPLLSEEEKRYRMLEEELIKSQEEQKTKEEWELPESWNGEKISWKLEKEDNSTLLFLLTVAAAGGSFFLKDIDLMQKWKKRKERIRDSYPLILEKLELYLGAGATIRGAFFRIGETYRRENTGRRDGMEIYEEILTACREIQSGVPEGRAYERLGYRSAVAEYVRLGTILNRELSKGSADLQSWLKMEAQHASDEQLDRIRRKGEEASSGLLIPMIIILGIILLMIMIPALDQMV